MSDYANTRFVIEASHREQHDLWATYSVECWRQTWDFPTQNKYTWQQINPGYLETVGEFHGFPVCISVNWVRINGVLVMFYEPVSRVVDREMVRDWLKKTCCPRWDNNTREAHCDAANFHHCISHVERLCKGEEK